jgi:hypothetical protein
MNTQKRGYVDCFLYIYESAAIGYQVFISSLLLLYSP